MTAFEIYTREDCPQCQTAINRLKDNGIDYKEFVVGKDISRDEVLQKFPDAKVTPIIWHVGGNQVVTGQMFDLMVLAEYWKKEKHNGTT